MKPNQYASEKRRKELDRKKKKEEKKIKHAELKNTKEETKVEDKASNQDIVE